jgi:hypothetical protein
VVSGGWLLTALTALLLPPAGHPSHTSSAEMVQGGDSIRVAIRVFADDIAAVGPVRHYIEARFGIVDRKGNAVSLEWVGAERAGDVLIIRLRGHLPAGLSRAKVRNGILTDRFADQVNVVRAAYQRGAATLIFSRGDGPKALP